MSPDFPRMGIPAAGDHSFILNVEVDEEGTALDVDGFLISVRASPDYSPVKLNFDRPVTDTEYTIVFPGIIKKVGRFTKTLYMKAPQGQQAVVTVEVLKLG